MEKRDRQICACVLEGFARLSARCRVCRGSRNRFRTRWDSWTAVIVSHGYYVITEHGLPRFSSSISISDVSSAVWKRSRSCFVPRHAFDAKTRERRSGPVRNYFTLPTA